MRTLAGLRAFVSSTCVDLDAYRAQLRSLLVRMGYEPMMSDHSEVLYDPELHTHASCLRDVEAADIIILMIGSRFGGTAVEQALPLIDFDAAISQSSSSDLLAQKGKISITQAEVLRAVELEKPIFAFVDAKVYSDHHIYLRNKGKSFIEEVDFPSIAKRETAKSIFDFISYLHHRANNNAITPFSGFADIENHLLRQWSLLFQRLLQEKRNKEAETRRSDAIIGRIDDLKAVVLQSISGDRERQVARNVIKYRRLVEVLVSAHSRPDFNLDLESRENFFDLLNIVEVVRDENLNSSYISLLILEDNSFYGGNVTKATIDRLSVDWESFKELALADRKTVYEGIAEATSGSSALDYHGETVSAYEEALDKRGSANAWRRRTLISPDTVRRAAGVVQSARPEIGEPLPQPVRRRRATPPKSD